MLGLVRLGLFMLGLFMWRKIWPPWILRNFGVVVERARSELRTRFRIPLPPTKKVFIGFVLYTSGTMKKRLLTLMIKSECINDSVRSLTPTGNCLTDHLPHEWYATMVPPMTRSGGCRLNNAKCDSLREEKRKNLLKGVSSQLNNCTKHMCRTQP